MKVSFSVNHFYMGNKLKELVINNLLISLIKIQIMKIKLLFFILVLISINQINAQCDGCSFDSIISFDGDNIFSAEYAQAYYWEICDGTATISGANTGSSVTINCNSNGNSTLKVTRFENGQCIESCLEFICIGGICNPPECECGYMLSSCIYLDFEGTPDDCETLFATLSSSCLPDCWESIDWRVKLGGIDQTYYNQGTSFSWDLPAFGYYNYYAVVTAIIHLENQLLNCIQTLSIKVVL